MGPCLAVGNLSRIQQDLHTDPCARWASPKLNPRSGLALASRGMLVIHPRPKEDNPLILIQPEAQLQRIIILGENTRRVCTLIALIEEFFMHRAAWLLLCVHGFVNRWLLHVVQACGTFGLLSASCLLASVYPKLWWERWSGEVWLPSSMVV